MPPACSTTKGSTACGCTSPYLACFIAVAAMAVASVMWHATGRAARVTTDGQVTYICIDWYMVTITCTMVQDEGDVRVPVGGVGMGGSTRATRGVRQVLARMPCHGCHYIYHKVMASYVHNLKQFGILRRETEPL